MTQTPWRDDNLRNGHILFKLGKWEIHSMIETPEIVEAFHHCVEYTIPNDRLEYSYQIPGDNQCPGCDAVQPDEIQGMVAMHNMDQNQPARWWGRSLTELLRKDIKRNFMEQWKAMSVKALFK